jgi:hypothetical protein
MTRALFAAALLLPSLAHAAWSAGVDVSPDDRISTFALDASRGQAIVLFGRSSQAAAVNFTKLRVRGTTGTFGTTINLQTPVTTQLPVQAVLLRGSKALLFYANVVVPFSLATSTTEPGAVVSDGPSTRVATEGLEQFATLFNAPAPDGQGTGVAVMQKKGRGDFTERAHFFIEGQPTAGGSIAVLADGGAWLGVNASGEGARPGSFFVARDDGTGWGDAAIEDGNGLTVGSFFASSADDALLHLFAPGQSKLRPYVDGVAGTPIDIEALGGLLGGVMRDVDDVTFCFLRDDGVELREGDPRALGEPLVLATLPEGFQNIRCIVNTRGDALVTYQAADGVHGAVVVQGVVAQADEVVTTTAPDTYRAAFDEVGNAHVAVRNNDHVFLSSFDSGEALPPEPPEPAEGEGEAGEGEASEGEAGEGETAGEGEAGADEGEAPDEVEAVAGRGGCSTSGVSPWLGGAALFLVARRRGLTPRSSR